MNRVREFLIRSPFACPDKAYAPGFPGRGSVNSGRQLPYTFSVCLGCKQPSALHANVPPNVRDDAHHTARSCAATVSLSIALLGIALSLIAAASATGSVETSEYRDPCSPTHVHLRPTHRPPA